MKYCLVTKAICLLRLPNNSYMAPSKSLKKSINTIKKHQSPEIKAWMTLVQKIPIVLKTTSDIRCLRKCPGSAFCAFLILDPLSAIQKSTRGNSVTIYFMRDGSTRIILNALKRTSAPLLKKQIAPLRNSWRGTFEDTTCVMVDINNRIMTSIPRSQISIVKK